MLGRVRSSSEPEQRNFRSTTALAQLESVGSSLECEICRTSTAARVRFGPAGRPETRAPVVGNRISAAALDSFENDYGARKTKPE